MNQAQRKKLLNIEYALSDVAGQLDELVTDLADPDLYGAHELAYGALCKVQMFNAELVAPALRAGREIALSARKRR